MESIETRASRLVKRLAVVETQEHHSKAIGFNQGPKKNGKIVTLHFEDGTNQGYTTTELYAANGIKQS